MLSSSFRFICGFGSLTFILLAATANAVPENTLSPQSVMEDQKNREKIFQELKGRAKGYDFDYFVIMIPPHTLPGVEFPFPVTHVRYKSDLLFGFDKSDLTANSTAVIQELAEALKGDKNTKSVLIVGHTDAIGPDWYNYLLSRRRATTVLATLQRAGLKKAILGLVPMGEAQPISSNGTSDGRAKNRRVEFFISDLVAASVKAVELVPFDPCHRNDQPGSPNPCETSVDQIPVYQGDDAEPAVTLNLRRHSRLEESSGRRPALPNNWPQRPPISKFRQPGQDF